VPRMPLVLCVLFLVGVEGSGAHAAMRQSAASAGQRARPNTWSARSSTGLILNGTFTAVVDAKTGTVSGTWILLDAQGNTMARGGWSAAKSPAGWSGAWRAATDGSNVAYSGTWTSSVDLKASEGFAALFEKAVQTAVSGNWRVGGRSGAWSVRAFN